MYEFIAQAFVFVCLGFAAGWLAAQQRLPPVAARTDAATIAHCSLQQYAQQPQKPAATLAQEVRSLPLVPARKEEASLIDRIYPLHEEGVAWDSLSLARYRVVLVTGPQRSGTTWAACALASSLGYTLYDERHPLTAGNNTLISLRRAFTFARQQPRGAVIQAPMATSVLHELPIFPGLAIVFIARHCLDVFRSQNRVMPHRGGWTCVAGRTKELRKYRMREELRPHFDERDMVCTIKQHAWQRYQRPLLERRANADERRATAYAGAGLPLCATVNFASFVSHPLWQGEEQRRNLSIKRTAGAHCAKLIKASTPLRSQRHVRQWAAEIEMAEAATRGRGEALQFD